LSKDDIWVDVCPNDLDARWELCGGCNHTFQVDGILDPETCFDKILSKVASLATVALLNTCDCNTEHL
jgi:hypothetical protein